MEAFGKFCIVDDERLKVDVKWFKMYTCVAITAQLAGYSFINRRFKSFIKFGKNGATKVQPEENRVTFSRRY